MSVWAFPMLLFYSYGWCVLRTTRTARPIYSRGQGGLLTSPETVQLLACKCLGRTLTGMQKHTKFQLYCSIADKGKPLLNGSGSWGASKPRHLASTSTASLCRVKLGRQVVAS